MLSTVLNFFTKSKLIELLDLLKDKEYKSSWSKGKLVSQLETYDAATIFQKMTVSQLDDLLTEHHLETSGKKATKVQRLVNSIENGDVSAGHVSSSQSESQTSSWQEELQQLMGDNDWEEKHKKELKQFYRLITGFLQEYSEIQKVEWKQYSLNFNDGDACPFEIQRMSLYFPEGVAYGSWSSIDEMFDKNDEEVTISPRVNKAGTLLWNILTLHQNTLECEYGNHSSITAQIKRKKISFDVEDFVDHD